MNLVRDLRYVSRESHLAFGKEERASDRRKAWRSVKKAHSSRKSNESQLQAAFDKRYPPGYFGRVNAFETGGKYGKWLLQQPTAVKVNGVVFVHGGLTPDVATLGLSEINRRVGRRIRAVMQASKRLAPSLAARYEDFIGLAKLILKGSQISLGGADSDLLSAAKVLEGHYEDLPFAPNGPVWYRGNSLENERAERERIDQVLEALQARVLMVAHTPTRSARITSRFNGAVVRSDVGMAYGRAPSAAVFEGETVRVLDPKSGTLSDPIVEPAHGEGWAYGYENIPDSQLERFLETAKVKERRVVSRGEQQAELWEMEGEGLRLRGVFKDIEERIGDRSVADARPRRYQHELAAYQLDRMLGLGLVPPVVAREFEGRKGAVRTAVETALDLVSLRTYLNLDGVTGDPLFQAVARNYGLDFEVLKAQAARVWIFDALIGNPGREEEDALLIPVEGRVAVVDHERAFSLATNVEAILRKPCDYLDPELELAIETLDEGRLGSDLGGFLSMDQVKAVMARRDRVLELCTGEGAGR